MKRKLTLLLLVLGAFVVAGFVVDCTPGRRISRKNYDMIALMMKDVDVEAILGPPGDYFSCPPDTYYYPPRGWTGPCIIEGNPTHYKYQKDWNGDRGGIRVSFDEEGSVVCKYYFFSSKKLRWWYWTPL